MAERGYVSKISGKRKNGVILLTSSKASVSVEFFGVNTVRVRVAPSGTFERDFSYSFDPLAVSTASVARISESRESIVLTGPWTGDNYASWDHMALSIPMPANMSVSGIPFVGCDVGGFNEMPSGELYARWLQAAALAPFLRSHSVG